MIHLPSTVHPIVDKQSSSCHPIAKHSTTYFRKWFFIKKTLSRAVQCNRSHMNVLHSVTGSEVSVKTVTKHFGSRRKHTLFYGTPAYRWALVCLESDQNPCIPALMSSASRQLSHRQDDLVNTLRRHFLQCAATRQRMVSTTKWTFIYLKLHFLPYLLPEEMKQLCAQAQRPKP